MSEKQGELEAKQSELGEQNNQLLNKIEQITLKSNESFKKKTGVRKEF